MPSSRKHHHTIIKPNRVVIEHESPQPTTTTSQQHKNFSEVNNMDPFAFIVPDLEGSDSLEAITNQPARRSSSKSSDGPTQQQQQPQPQQTTQSSKKKTPLMETNAKLPVLKPIMVSEREYRKMKRVDKEGWKYAPFRVFDTEAEPPPPPPPRSQSEHGRRSVPLLNLDDAQPESPRKSKKYSQTLSRHRRTTHTIPAEIESFQGKRKSASSHARILLEAAPAKSKSRSFDKTLSTLSLSKGASRSLTSSSKKSHKTLSTLASAKSKTPDELLAVGAVLDHLSKGGSLMDTSKVYREEIQTQQTYNHDGDDQRKAAYAVQGTAPTVVDTTTTNARKKHFNRDYEASIERGAAYALASPRDFVETALIEDDDDDDKSHPENKMLEDLDSIASPKQAGLDKYERDLIDKYNAKKDFEEEERDWYHPKGDEETLTIVDDASDDDGASESFRLRVGVDPFATPVSTEDEEDSYSDEYTSCSDDSDDDSYSGDSYHDSDFEYDSAENSILSNSSTITTYRSLMEEQDKRLSLRMKKKNKKHRITNPEEIRAVEVEWVHECFHDDNDENNANDENTKKFAAAVGLAQAMEDYRVKHKIKSILKKSDIDQILKNTTLDSSLLALKSTVDTEKKEKKEKHKQRKKKKQQQQKKKHKKKKKRRGKMHALKKIVGIDFQETEDSYESPIRKPTIIDAVPDNKVNTESILKKGFCEVVPVIEDQKDKSDKGKEKPKDKSNKSKNSALLANKSLADSAPTFQESSSNVFANISLDEASKTKPSFGLGVVVPPQHNKNDDDDEDDDDQGSVTGSTSSMGSFCATGLSFDLLEGDSPTFLATALEFTSTSLKSARSIFFPDTDDEGSTTTTAKTTDRKVDMTAAAEFEAEVNKLIEESETLVPSAAASTNHGSSSQSESVSVPAVVTTPKKRPKKAKASKKFAVPEYADCDEGLLSDRDEKENEEQPVAEVDDATEPEESVQHITTVKHKSRSVISLCSPKKRKSFRKIFRKKTPSGAATKSTCSKSSHGKSATAKDGIEYEDDDDELGEDDDLTVDVDIAVHHRSRTMETKSVTDGRSRTMETKSLVDGTGGEEQEEEVGDDEVQESDEKETFKAMLASYDRAMLEAHKSTVQGMRTSSNNGGISDIFMTLCSPSCHKTNTAAANNPDQSNASGLCAQTEKSCVFDQPIAAVQQRDARDERNPEDTYESPPRGNGSRNIITSNREDSVGKFSSEYGHPKNNSSTRTFDESRFHSDSLREGPPSPSKSQRNNNNHTNHSSRTWAGGRSLFTESNSNRSWAGRSIFNRKNKKKNKKNAKKQLQQLQQQEQMLQLQQQQILTEHSRSRSVSYVDKDMIVFL